MKWIILGALLALGPMPLGAQENGASTLVGKLLLDPVVVGFRYDDNVLRSVSSSNRLADGIYSLNLGGTGTLEVGRLRMEGVYQLGDDQYQ
ncbi:MAG TPA: hypothetical protein VHE12_10530, partial [bacterium]|nr:hypothetical protein [bacterium]